ncbi:hypothetical protein EYF80_039596 [Liparis tanakae]|uniref:Uncharacterized protein n=1 Tax=Liparis tanakae TaxID=230148 RepID=A0A4Z2GC23_9TELE|nr:hypothetical protein EYF80_039596 [Liparis tanakae]
MGNEYTIERPPRRVLPGPRPQLLNNGRCHLCVERNTRRIEDDEFDANDTLHSVSRTPGRNEEPQLHLGMEVTPPPKHRIKVSNVVGDAIATRSHYEAPIRLIKGFVYNKNPHPPPTLPPKGPFD